MKKITILLSLIILLSTVYNKCNAQHQKRKSIHPNVLLIMIDDLNDYEGSYGGHPQAQTPNIDKLAHSGVVFSNAHSNVPVCSPSRNSMFTGIYPHTSRDFGWTNHFDQAVLKNAKTFIELFRENGYKTYGSGKILNKNVLDYWDEWAVPERINYGPFAYDGKKPVGHPSVHQPFRDINSVDGSFAPLSDIPKFDVDGLGLKETGWIYPGGKKFRYINDDDRDPMPDEMHANWAVNKIKELGNKSDNQPFFLGVGFVRPHTPLYAPKKYFDKFPLDKIQLPVIKHNDKEDIFYSTVYPDSEMGLHYFQELKKSYPGDEGLKRFLQAYLACISFMDDQVGKVIDALNNSKFKENTIVLLTSDHGWQIGEKDYLYKNSPWEESTHIPFILRVPGESTAGTVVDHPVSLIDVYPTFVDLCSLKGSTKKKETAPETAGFSLRPFLKNPDFSEWGGPDGALTVLGAGINHPIEGLGVSNNKNALWHIKIIKDLDESFVLKQNYTYRTKNWRYIRYHNGKEELYDHRIDPNEWNNLALNKVYSSKLKELREKVLKMIKK